MAVTGERYLRERGRCGVESPRMAPTTSAPSLLVSRLLSSKWRKSSQMVCFSRKSTPL
jgi:hypothetical protein